MNPNLKSVLLNVVASALWAIFGGGLVILLKRLSDRSAKAKRLREISEASREGNVAICVRVGGRAAALPDVEDYLRKNLREIRTLLSYDVASSDLKADGSLINQETAASIVEDIVEGLAAYGKGTQARVHFFPSGIVAFAPLLLAIMTNWGRVVVYHLTEQGYVPLYELSKDRIHRATRVSRQPRIGRSSEYKEICYQPNRNRESAPGHEPEVC
jgi:hypothetical protein